MRHNNHRFTAIMQVNRRPALASTSRELENFVGAKFYCPHAIADSNQCIRSSKKTLEFSTVLSTLSPKRRCNTAKNRMHVYHAVMCSDPTKKQ